MPRVRWAGLTKERLEGRAFEHALVAILRGCEPKQSIRMYLADADGGGREKWRTLTAAEDDRVPGVIARMLVHARRVGAELAAQGYRIIGADAPVQLADGSKRSVDVRIEDEDDEAIICEAKWCSGRDPQRALKAAREALPALRGLLKEEARAKWWFGSKRRRVKAAFVGALGVSRGWCPRAGRQCQTTWWLDIEDATRGGSVECVRSPKRYKSGHQKRTCSASARQTEAQYRRGSVHKAIEKRSRARPEAQELARLRGATYRAKPEAQELAKLRRKKYKEKQKKLRKEKQRAGAVRKKLRKKKPTRTRRTRCRGLSLTKARFCKKNCKTCFEMYLNNVLHIFLFQYVFSSTGLFKQNCSFVKLRSGMLSFG